MPTASVDTNGNVLCGKCGHTNYAGSTKCRYCSNSWELSTLPRNEGKPSKQSDELAAELTEPNPSDTDQAAKKVKERPKSGLVDLSFGIALLVIGFLVLMVTPEIRVGNSSVSNPFSKAAIPLLGFGVWKLCIGIYRIMFSPAPKE